MNQLTIRGYDDELAQRLRNIAKKEGISLNKAAIRLLRKGANLAEPALEPDAIGSGLDPFIGTWTDEEADAIQAEVDEAFGNIDEDLWR